MAANVQKPEDPSSEGMAKLILDLLHRTIVHITLWFVEVERQQNCFAAGGFICRPRGRRPK